MVAERSPGPILSWFSMRATVSGLSPDCCDEGTGPDSRGAGVALAADLPWSCEPSVPACRDESGAVAGRGPGSVESGDDLYAVGTTYGAKRGVVE